MACSLGLHRTIVKILNGKPWFHYRPSTGTIRIMESKEANINRENSFEVATVVADTINNLVEKHYKGIGKIAWPQIGDDLWATVKVHATDKQLNYINGVKYESDKQQQEERMYLEAEQRYKQETSNEALKRQRNTKEGDRRIREREFLKRQGVTKEMLKAEEDKLKSYMSSIGLETDRVYTFEEVINKIIKGTEVRFLKQVLKSINRLVGDKIKVRILFSSKRDKKAAGYYDAPEDIMVINLPNLSSRVFLINKYGREYQEKTDIVSVFNRVFVHELIHAFTIVKLAAAPLNVRADLASMFYNRELPKVRLTTADKRAIESLKKIYDFLADNKLLKDEYGITNIYELVTEALSNEGFAEKLKNIKLPEDLRYKPQYENVFENIIAYISEMVVNLLGLKEDLREGESALESVAAIINDLGVGYHHNDVQIYSNLYKAVTELEAYMKSGRFSSIVKTKEPDMHLPEYTDNIEEQAEPQDIFIRDYSENHASEIAYAHSQLNESIRLHLQKLFPGITVFTDANKFGEFVRKNFGSVFDHEAFGAAIANAVYINPERARQDTLIHEYAHIYWDMLPENDSAKKNLLKLLDPDDVMHPDAREELAITMIGVEGLNLAQAMFSSSMLVKFISSVRQFWRKVKDMLGIASDRDIASLIAERLLNNKDKLDVREAQIHRSSLKYFRPQQVRGNESAEAERIVIDRMQKVDPRVRKISDISLKSFISETLWAQLSEEELAEAGIENVEEGRFATLAEKNHYLLHKTSKPYGPLTQRMFYNQMYNTSKAYHSMMKNLEERANFMAEYNRYLQEYQKAELLWSKIETMNQLLVLVMNKTEWAKFKKKVSELRTIAGQDINRFIAKIDGIWTVYDGMQTEYAENREYKPMTEFASEMLDGIDAISSDWHASGVVSGKYSMVGQYNVQQPALRALKIISDRLRRRADSLTSTHHQQIRPIIERIKETKADWNKIIYEQNGMLFFANPRMVSARGEVTEASQQYKALENSNNPADKALKDFIDYIYKWDSERYNRQGYGAEWKYRGRIRVPVIKADITELLKKHPWDEAVKMYLNRGDYLDNVIIRVKGLSKPMMRVIDAKRELFRKAGKNVAKIAWLKVQLAVLESHAKAQMMSGVNADGTIIARRTIHSIGTNIGFRIRDDMTRQYGLAVMRYIKEQNEADAMDQIEPMARFIEDYYGSTGRHENILRWLKIMNNDMLYKVPPDTEAGMFEPVLRRLVNYAHWLYLGINIFTMPLNATMGFVQSVRELGFRTTLRGLKRLFQSLKLTRNFKEAFIYTRAIDIMRKFEIVNISADIEMSISTKTAAVVSGVVFSPITVVEYLNYAYAFIGRMTNEEWEAISSLPKDASTEEYVRALAVANGADPNDKEEVERIGTDRINDLHEFVQMIQGPYSKYGKRGINKTTEGRSIMQFINWLPELFISVFGLFGSPKRFRTVHSGYQRRGLIWTGKDLLKVLFKGNPAKIGERWNSLDRFEKENVKRLMNQLLFAAGFTMIVLSLDDDDEENRRTRQYLDRAIGGIVYFWDFEQMTFKLKAPVPALNAAADIYKILGEFWRVATFRPSTYERTTVYHDKGDWKLPVYIQEATPIVRSISKLRTEIVEEQEFSD